MSANYWFNEKRQLRQLLFIVALTIFAGSAISGHFLINGTLFHEVNYFYSFFYDNLHSLNYFKEPAWWFPHNQFGFPGYISSILGGTNNISPSFMSLAFLFWLAGKLGVHIKSIHTVYVLHFGFIVPFMVNVGVWLVAKQLFRSNAVVIYALILSAFSPGVVTTISNVGVYEMTAYGLYFAAAFIYFVRVPKRSSFLVLSLTIFILASTLSFSFFLWDFIFIPVFIICSMIPLESYKKINQALSTVRLKYWLIIAVLSIICTLPVVISYFQDPITRPGGGSKRYLLNIIRPGNPMELLGASTPGIGFAWDWDKHSDHATVRWLPTPIGLKHPAHAYLGLLALSLSIFGLIFGREKLRLRLFIMLMIFFTVFVFASYSPLFAFLATFVPIPFLYVDHYSDLMYESGGFMVLLFSSALGLEAFLQNRTNLRWSLIIGFIISALLTSTLFLFLHSLKGEDPSRLLDPMFGLIVIMTILFLVVLVWLVFASDDADKRRYLTLFLILTLIDLSTGSYWYIKNFILPNAAKSEYNTQNPDHIGIISELGNMRANTYMVLPEMDKLQRNKIPVEKLPQFSLYGKAHISENISMLDFTLAASSDESRRSLPLSKDVMQGYSTKGLLGDILGKAGKIELKEEDIAVSSVHESHVRKNLIDGNRETFWHVKHPKQERDDFIEIDMREDKTVRLLRILPRIGSIDQMWDAENAFWEGSDDKYKWRLISVLQVEKSKLKDGEWVNFAVPGGQKFRYYKLYFTDPNFLSLAELELYSFTPANANIQPLPSSKTPIRIESLNKFLLPYSSNKENVGSVQIIRKTYNKLRLQVISQDEALLFIRDSFHPYWKGTVNGVKSPVIRVFGNFKAVVVPSGDSEVYLKFSPPLIGQSILVTYAIIFCTGIVYIFFKRREHN